jgi:hypothetical protein
MPLAAFRAHATLATAVFIFFLWGVKGNDTGGIIPWSPGIEETALNTASDHCARYGKYAVITSVHPWPGDYIGFVCRRPDRWGPVSR